MSFYKNRYFFKTKDISISQLKIILASDKIDYIDLILLFGSRVDGTHHSKSDYDFAVYFSNKLDEPWGDISKVWNDIGDLLGLNDCDYDIIDLSNANKNILNSIKEQYILIKGDDNELQRLFNSYN